MRKSGVALAQIVQCSADMYYYCINNHFNDYTVYVYLRSIIHHEYKLQQKLLNFEQIKVFTVSYSSIVFDTLVLH